MEKILTAFKIPFQKSCFYLFNFDDCFIAIIVKLKHILSVLLFNLLFCHTNARISQSREFSATTLPIYWKPLCKTCRKGFKACVVDWPSVEIITHCALLRRFALRQQTCISSVSLFTWKQLLLIQLRTMVWDKIPVIWDIIDLSN